MGSDAASSPGTSSPPPRQHPYIAAERIAWRDLEKRSPGEIAADAQARLALPDTLAMDVLGRRCEVSLSRDEVLVDGASEQRPFWRVLILRYLAGARPVPLEGRWVGFAEIPGAVSYEGPFRGRVLDRIARRFGDDPGEFAGRAQALGGVKAKLAEHAFRFFLLPRVPAIVILWPGSEDVGPSAQILFDGSVGAILSVEDIVVLAQELASELSRR